jgi:hypothetical protein
VPLAKKAAVFQTIHILAPFFGIQAIKCMVIAIFVWKGVSKEVTTMCQDCQRCQHGKVNKQPSAPLHTIPVPACRFIHVQEDLVDPLQASSEGHLFLLKAIDRSTMGVKAVPLRNMEASMCLNVFMVNWMVCFGVLATVTTDRGTPFTSALWTGTCMHLGIKHVLTTATTLKAMGW